jgi:hypothetical protein
MLAHGTANCITHGNSAKKSSHGSHASITRWSMLKCESTISVNAVSHPLVPALVPETAHRVPNCFVLQKRRQGRCRFEFRDHLNYPPLLHSLHASVAQTQRQHQHLLKSHDASRLCINVHHHISPNPKTFFLCRTCMKTLHRKALSKRHRPAAKAEI